MQTRLAQFMAANGITDEQLAIHAGVAISTVEKVRAGKADPRRPTIVWLAGAAGRILDRRVKARELFDLGDDDD